MSKFKAGDAVRRIHSGNNKCALGEVVVVEEQTSKQWLKLVGKGGWTFDPYTFELVYPVIPEYPNPPHNHAELIKAWADGAEIEYYSLGCWYFVTHPTWGQGGGYRIKPQRSDKDIQKDAQIERLEQQALDLANEIKKLKE